MRAVEYHNAWVERGAEVSSHRLRFSSATPVNRRVLVAAVFRFYSQSVNAAEMKQLSDIVAVLVLCAQGLVSTINVCSLACLIG